MKTKRITAVITAVLISMALLSGSVFISHGLQKKGSVSLDYELSDVRFYIFKVGNITESGVVATEPYSAYHVDLMSENAAYTLMSYIERDRSEPLRTIVTDEGGSAVFDDLERGVYLITGESTVKDDVCYTVMPSLISLPSADSTSVEWHVTVVIKYGKENVFDRINLSCVKIWKDDRDTVHPEIHVELLCNGEEYDTVLLNEENNWKYSWNDLDPNCSWLVTEEEFDGDYSVDISRDQYTFTIVNTVNDTDEPGSEPTSPSDSVTSPSDSPTAPSDSPATPSETKTPGTTGSGTIPQTGQLNWPIPLLAGTGVILCSVGVLLLIKKCDKDE